MKREKKDEEMKEKCIDTILKVEGVEQLPDKTVFQESMEMFMTEVDDLEIFFEEAKDRFPMEEMLDDVEISSNSLEELDDFSEDSDIVFDDVKSVGTQKMYSLLLSKTFFKNLGVNQNLRNRLNFEQLESEGGTNFKQTNRQKEKNSKGSELKKKIILKARLVNFFYEESVSPDMEAFYSNVKSQAKNINFKIDNMLKECEDMNKGAMVKKNFIRK